MNIHKTAAITLLLGTPSTAFAWSADDPTRAFSLTASPIHLLVGIVELTGELQVGQRHGLAVLAGYGQIDSIDVAEAGGSYRYYILGNFDRGLQLGAEMLIASGTQSDTSVTVVSPSAFVGGKFTAGGGFTLGSQLGVGTLDGAVSPLLNLNLGWSFGQK